VPRISLIYIDNKIILTNKKGIKNMSITKKHFIEISNIIRNNYEFTKEFTNNKWEFNHTINTKVISDLSEYFRTINDRFDMSKFITNSVPNKDRHEDTNKLINKIEKGGK